MFVCGFFLIVHASPVNASTGKPEEEKVKITQIQKQTYKIVAPDKLDKFKTKYSLVLDIF